MVSNEGFAMHPNNYRKFKDAMTCANDFVSFPSPTIQSIHDMINRFNITIDKSIPEREVTTIWHPPKDGRFTSYGPEDEHWMRPLGLGWVEYINGDPVIFKYDFRALEMPLLVPHSRHFICKNFS